MLGPFRQRHYPSLGNRRESSAGRMRGTMKSLIRSRRATLPSASSSITARAIAPLLGATLLLALAAPSAMATADAPSLPPGMRLRGSGPLNSISGRLGTRVDVDMYRICLTDGVSFSATTVGTATETPRLPDPQLFLFNRFGRGVYANDDSALSTQSSLPAYNRPPGPVRGGVFFLAISSYDNDPVDAQGRLIFPSTPFSAVVGPRPGVGPIADWNDRGGSRGAYTIRLTGAEFCGTSGSGRQAGQGKASE